MKFLAVALLICSLYSLSDAHCSIFPHKPGMTHCMDDVDNTWHPLGSSWRNSKCMDCTCSGCCSAYSTPVQYPSDCMAEMDWIACEYKVFKKNDPSIICPIYGAVGK